MDNLQFDRWTQFLATDTGRRPLLRGVAASLLALFGGGGAASAACRKVRQKCEKHRDCCAGARCHRRRRCVCKAGRGDCNRDGRCESLLSDVDNCGRCGRTGGSAGRCFNGACGGDDYLCPLGCSVCFARRQGGFICSGADDRACADRPRCTRDTDCPPGSACGQQFCGNEVMSFCTVPC